VIEFSFRSIQRGPGVHKISMAVAAWPWPLTSWPWKPFQQCPAMWRICVPSFVEISPLSEEKSHHAD